MLLNEVAGDVALGRALRVGFFRGGDRCGQAARHGDGAVMRDVAGAGGERDGQQQDNGSQGKSSSACRNTGATGASSRAGACCTRRMAGRYCVVICDVVAINA